jgi:hypothetical protein
VCPANTDTVRGLRAPRGKCRFLRRIPCKLPATSDFALPIPSSL